MPSLAASCGVKHLSYNTTCQSFSRGSLQASRRVTLRIGEKRRSIGCPSDLLRSSNEVLQMTDACKRLMAMQTVKYYTDTSHYDYNKLPGWLQTCSWRLNRRETHRGNSDSSTRAVSDGHRDGPKKIKQARCRQQEVMGTLTHQEMQALIKDSSCVAAPNNLPPGT